MATREDYQQLVGILNEFLARLSAQAAIERPADSAARDGVV